MPELIDLITTNFDYDNFFSAKLTAPMTASDTDVFLDAIPTPSEGVLVIDWDVADSREIIFYNSKTASKVTCPSVANGRGFDDTTATTHLSGANVIMAPVRAWFRLAQQLATTSTAAWKALGYNPTTITDNGNGSFTMVFNSVDLTSFISPGMRLKGTPTTAKPTQCASLNGTTQYFNKTSPAGMTFTDDFVIGGWIKPSSYTNSIIASRHNGTSGFYLQYDGSGRLSLVGTNGGAGNYSLVISYQSLRLNRWTHAAAQLDMSAFTATTTTSYIMMDGKDVPASVTRAGTNPTALVQAGNLEIGSYNGGTLPFPGKLAQVFISSAKITQANINLLKNQGITASDCSTYSIASAYSLSGASGATDINTTNANNLTAQGSATTTTSDSPFGLNSFGTPGTSEFGIVMSATYSTNTTVVVQTPEGCTWPTLPTSSAISAMYYSTEKVPYGMPITLDKYTITTIFIAAVGLGGSASTWYSGLSAGAGSYALKVPVGNWELSYSGNIYSDIGATSRSEHSTILSTNATTPATSEYEMLDKHEVGTTSANSYLTSSHYRSKQFNITSDTTYYLLARYSGVTSNASWGGNASIPTIITAKPQFV